MFSQQPSQGLGTVTVDKVKLLETLVTNMKIHVTEHNASVAGFRKKYLEKLSELTAIANDTPDDDLTKWQQSLQLMVPVSHEKDYSTAIEMLKWSVDSTAMLTQTQFQQFILDEWSWKTLHMTNQSLYC